MGGPQGYMAAPMGYPYPAMNGYGGQPGMMPGMRGGGPMMGYPPQQMMQQARPRYQPAGQPGMNMPYGMPPPQMGYPGMPQGYPPRPTNVNARPPTSAPNANNRSPVGAPQGLPQGTMPRGAQMPMRPPQGYPDAGTAQQGPPRLSAQSLARASPQDQKQMLGEAIYPLISE